MAKRSDFAQKLLDDLRLRKERMGLAQTSHRPDLRATDANGNSRWSFRGSGEAASKRFNSKNMMSSEVTRKSLGTRQSRTPAPEVASKEIVPLVKARMRTESNIDLSMALAFAFSNGGKNINLELYGNPTSNKGFILRQASVDFGELGGRHRALTGRFPFLSHLHIGEISRGTQNFNNVVLRACSNGLSFSRESIDFGRELLKGAIDLEESLRMLVSLQEASNYMVSNQGRRQMIRLLGGEEEEEDEPSTPEAKQLMTLSRPWFSFDRTSRCCSPGEVRGVFKNSILELKTTAASSTRKRETPRPKPSKSSSSGSPHVTTHRRSTGCGARFSPDSPFSSVGNSHSEEVWNSSDSRNGSCTSKCADNMKQVGSQCSSEREKVRIPNVIAKLMGLEEFPQSDRETKISETQKVLKSKKGMGTGKNSNGTVGEVDIVTISGKSGSQKEGQRKVLQEKGGVATQPTNAFEVMKSKGKADLRNMNVENTSVISKSSQKRHSKIDEQTKPTIVERSRETLSKKEVMSCETTNSKGEQKNKAKAEQILRVAPKKLLEFGSQAITPQQYKFPGGEDAKHDFARRKKNLVQNERLNLKKETMMQIYQLKPTNDSEPKHLPVVDRSSESISHGAATEVENNARNHLKSAKAIGGLVSKKSKQLIHEVSRRKLVTRNPTIISSKRSSANVAGKKQAEDSTKSYQEVDERLKNGGSKSDGEKVMPLVPAGETTRPAHLPQAEKVKITREAAHKTENPKKTQENTRGAQPPGAGGPPSKQQLQTSVLQELKRSEERISKAEEAIVSPNSPNLEGSLHEEAATPPPSCSPVIDDCLLPMRADIETPTDTTSHDDIIIDDSAAQQAPETPHAEDLKLHPSDLKANNSQEMTDRKQISNYNPSRQLKQESSEYKGQISLTENEKHLRQILVNNQHFLGTVQALFKLRIPVGIIQASKTKCQDQGCKLTLDCGYEVMRRKGNREELTSHSPMKLSSGAVKVRCLDDLIRDLNIDLESLTFPGENEDEDNDTAELLHKLLVRDIENKNPDVNCMWDFGWNSVMFANPGKDEVGREMEKHVLNGLINETVKDLMM